VVRDALPNHATLRLLTLGLRGAGRLPAMTHARLPAAILFGLAMGVAACGGGSSGGGTAAGGRSSAVPSSAASSGSVAPSSGGGSGSNPAFCAVFTDIKTELSGAASASRKDAASTFRDLASKVESKAPPELKNDAKNLADYYRALADAADQGKRLSTAPSLTTDYGKSIGAVGVWVATHCSTS
jgi:hypothetical protein